MLRLMNAAMIATEGSFFSRRISADDAVRIIREAATDLHCNFLDPQTVRHLRELTGLHFTNGMSEDHLEDGDRILKVRWIYRPMGPGIRGVEKYWEYYLITFSASLPVDGVSPSDIDREVFIAKYSRAVNDQAARDPGWVESGEIPLDDPDS